MTQSVASSVVAIDIGNTKVSVIIARVKDHNTLNVIGMSHVDNKGMKQGKVTDLGLLTEAIKQAIAEAEQKSSCRVHHAWVSIPSEELYCVIENAIIGISDGEINTSHMVEVREIAKSKCIKPNYYVTNAIPLAYYIDDSQDEVSDPLGMVAHQLQAHYHFIMMPVNTMQNIRQALKNLNIRVSQIVISPLATAMSCLLEDEKKEGICLLDIGAEITNIIAYFDGKMVSAHALAVGGEFITQNIQNHFNVSYDEADRLKLKYGTLDYENLAVGKMIRLTLLNGEYRTISKADLVEVIIKSYRHIFNKVHHVLLENELEKLPRGIVITGGASQIDNIVKIAKQELRCPIHLANRYEYVEHQEPTQQILLSTPRYQTAVGLAVYSLIDNTSSPDQITDVPRDIWSKIGFLWKKFVQIFKKIV